MNEILNQVSISLSKSINELDIKLSFINTKLNKLNKHLVYLYLLLLLNTIVNIIYLFK